MSSVYEIITEKIIKQLKSGVAPWRKPWTCQTLANLLTQKEYRGLNVFTLASQGVSITVLAYFQSGNEAGREDSQGREVLARHFLERWRRSRDHHARRHKKTSRPFLLRYYSVFNLSQTEGIDLPASILQETRNPVFRGYGRHERARRVIFCARMRVCQESICGGPVEGDLR